MSEIEVVATPSLGDRSYLLVSGDEAMLVDPQRDVWSLLAACQDRGLAIRYVLETHVHNDYLSGALEVRAATGAHVAGPARASYGFPHLPLADGDEVLIGGLTVRAVETPGHTPEHTSYLVFDRPDVAPLAVLTGGSLIVGGAGRTDLAGQECAEKWARAQYHALRRLACLPAETQVLPTHGWGSFCSVGAPPGRSTSTIGVERRSNPALRQMSEEEFVRERLCTRPPYPAYYASMAPINRAGPRLLGALPALAPRTPDEVCAAADRGGWVVDARDRWSFAAGHLATSLNIELDETFATYVGWLVPFGAPLILVLPDPVRAAAAEAMRQLVRIGYDEQALGYLDGGIVAWHAPDRPLRAYPVADVGRLRERLALVPAEAQAVDDVCVLDVRQPGEFAAARVPGSINIPVGELADRLDQVPTAGGPVWTICRTGRRSALAASLLDRAGIPAIPVTSGGVPDWPPPS